jgi:aspartyl-tRNA(Asn)/glutamyl-tRNA(Gln) amidotransferase subunit A
LATSYKLQATSLNLNKLTIAQASKGIQSKEFSVTELASDCLKAIQEKDKDIHAYLEVFDDAKKQAEEADKKFAAIDNIAELPPLFGIPIAIKDNILIEGKRCTAASKILENYVASYDATVVKKLKDQGAILLGKTNLDEFAMGASTEYSAFGATNNPRDTGRVPGGSSGGSAVAVAAEMCLGALGSDTGGSIRQPAAYCGVVGMKTTYGSVSRHGLIAMASSLDQIGPIAKSVEDARILFGAIAGGDDFDATALRENVEFRSENIGLKGLRVGVPKEYFSDAIKPDVEKVIRDAIKKIENSGALVKEVSLPHTPYALACYYIIVPSEVSANLARFDGIRYGLSVDTGGGGEKIGLYEVYARSRREGFGQEVKRRIMTGTYALSAGYYDAYYLKAQKVRRLVSEDFQKAFVDVDVLVNPTTPHVASRIGGKSDPIAMYFEDIFTVPASLAGVPALSLPAGVVVRDGKKLPVGLQLTFARGGDYRLLSIAEKIESIIS